MILEANKKIETNFQGDFKEFSINISDTTFQLLTTSLYKNPINAIIRELLTNAYDAHIEANTLNIPIEVYTTIDSNKSYTLIIRDYGTGLSDEDIQGIYSTFLASTKNKSNEYTGCYGLGSKTPLAYTSSFIVISYYNKVETKYLITSINNVPNIAKISSKETTEPNGLYIQIPIKDSKDRATFILEMKKYVKFNDVNVIFNDDTFVKEKPLISIEPNIKIYTDTSIQRSEIYIKQGQNLYPVENFHLPQISDHTIVVIDVPIGSISIPPSRDNIIYDNKTTKFLKGLHYKVNKSINKLLGIHLNNPKSSLTDVFNVSHIAKILNKILEKNNIYSIEARPHYYGTNIYIRTGIDFKVYPKNPKGSLTLLSLNDEYIELVYGKQLSSSSGRILNMYIAKKKVKVVKYIDISGIDKKSLKNFIRLYKHSIFKKLFNFKMVSYTAVKKYVKDNKLKKVETDTEASFPITCIVPKRSFNIMKDRFYDKAIWNLLHKDSKYFLVDSDALEYLECIYNKVYGKFYISLNNMVEKENYLTSIDKRGLYEYIFVHIKNKKILKQLKNRYIFTKKDLEECFKKDIDLCHRQEFINVVKSYRDSCDTLIEIFTKRRKDKAVAILKTEKALLDKKMMTPKSTYERGVHSFFKDYEGVYRQLKDRITDRFGYMPYVYRKSKTIELYKKVYAARRRNKKCFTLKTATV